MTPEEFIKRHPFPPNGAEINDKLVKDIQNPSKQDERDSNLQRLLENNARLIYLIYYQYNYNQTLASIMSFTFEGLCKATETYDPGIGMPFYHYAMQTTRGLLQNWYNYNNDLIHVPVMKKKDVKIDYSDINDYNEHQEGSNWGDMEAFVQPDDDNVTLELDKIIEKSSSFTNQNSYNQNKENPYANYSKQNNHSDSYYKSQDKSYPKKKKEGFLSDLFDFEF